MQKENLYLNDGRQGEKISTGWRSRNENLKTLSAQQEESIPCDEERVTEIYVEKPREKYIQQRIIERRKPFVYEKEIEDHDLETGEVIRKTIESIDDNEIKSRVVDRIETQNYKESCDCSGPISKKDLIEAFKYYDDFKNGKIKLDKEDALSIQQVADSRNYYDNNTSWFSKLDITDISLVIALLSVFGLFVYYAVFM